MNPLIKFAPDKTPRQKRGDVIKVVIVSLVAITIFGVFGGLSHLAEEPLEATDNPTASASPTPTAVFDQCGNIAKGLEQPLVTAEDVLLKVADGEFTNPDKLRLRTAALDAGGIQATITMEKCRTNDKAKADKLDAGIDAVEEAAEAELTKDNVQPYLDAIGEASDV